MCEGSAFATNLYFASYKMKRQNTCRLCLNKRKNFPLLFNLVADIFTRMLIKAARSNLVSGLMPQVIEGGIISLQYADDTLLFLENDIEKAKNLKWLLLFMNK